MHVIEYDASFASTHYLFTSWHLLDGIAMSIIFCTQRGIPVLKSLTMDPFQSRKMTRLSLKGLWRTMSLFSIQNSNAEINSSMYLDRCSSLFSIIHPSLVPSDISARFFWTKDWVQWPLPELNPNCLLICLNEMSLGLDVIKSPLLLGSLVGVGRRLTQRALTTDHLATLGQHRPPFLSRQFFVLCINFLRISAIAVQASSPSCWCW